METYFDVMAQHPNCILAVDATDGGKWKSNFRAPQLVNFATKSKTWTNFNANFNTDAGIKYTDDFEFEIDFEWNLTPEEFLEANSAMPIFYSKSSETSPIGIFVYSSGKIGVFTSCMILNTTGEVSSIGGIITPITSALPKGTHKIKIQYSYSTNKFNVYLDQDYSFTKSLNATSYSLTDFSITLSPLSYFNGGIHSATLTKTTGGTRTLLWDAKRSEIQTNLSVVPTAPTGTGTFEETHGLLTKNNVVAENDYFKSDVKYSTLNSSINMNGYIGDFTTIIKLFKEYTSTSLVMMYQGNTYIQIVPSSNYFALRLNDGINGKNVVYYTFPATFDWSVEHTFACVTSQTNAKLFIDGELVQTKAYTPMAYCATGGQLILFQFSESTQKFYSAMIFDKALSADEIKILSNCMNGI